MPDNHKVRIRMYRQGLGDCFLLTFYGDEKPRHMLIDCGVMTGTPGGKKKIREVAASVSEETKGALDVLAVSHEHWDHVSGFYDARDIFDPMQVQEIWVAWTEDPGQEVAKERKLRARLQLNSVRAALAKMSASDDMGTRARGAALAETLGFWGSVDASSLMAFSEKSEEAMNAVTQRDPNPKYWKPGECIQRSWLPGVRVYVLGPPLDPSMLRQEEGRAGTDVYGLRGGPEDDFYSAALGLRPLAPALPFDAALQWLDPESIRKNPDFGPLYQRYAEEPWRRIDDDWLYSAARMALQLDGATNNTSLVLAVELIDSGNVLLFPGDAQVGNWRSWGDLSWELIDEDETKTVAAADLLQRTVFYKVGHHGSDNATLKEGGLEAMASPELVAAIPVDQKFANNTKNWEMPAKALYQRLNEKTKGRVLRADWAWPTEDDEKPSALNDGEWTRFVSSVSVDPKGLFLDYYVS
jgi:beta-lactamase superfamily II metal-dependent hydrolase